MTSDAGVSRGVGLAERVNFLPWLIDQQIPALTCGDVPGVRGVTGVSRGAQDGPIAMETSRRETGMFGFGKSDQDRWEESEAAQEEFEATSAEVENG